MFNCIQYIEADLENQIFYSKILKDRLRTLRRLKGINLNVQKKKGNYYYSQNTTIDGELQQKYLGKADSSTVKSLKEYAVISNALFRCENNIKILQHCIDNYQQLDTQDIVKNLKCAYRVEPFEVESMFGFQSADAWQRNLEAEKEAAGSFMPEGLKHRTSDGTLVRSLSEMVIYNELTSLGIAFVYEPPYEVGGRLYRPDFVAYHPGEDREIIIEMLGMLANPTYSEANWQKYMQYYASGYVQGDNLLIFVNDINGNLDALTVRRMLKARFE